MTKNKINKSKTIAIALILVLTMTIVAAVVTALPAVAHSPPWQVPTYAFVAVTPTLIGVNQQVNVVMWLNQLPPTSSGFYGDRWQGYQITVTKPDGTKTTLGPFNGDPVGSGYTTFTPTQIGIYTFVFSWPGQTITGGTGGQKAPNWGPGADGYESLGDTYQASTSDPVTLTVQQQQIQPYQETPLPTGYWERPVYAANRNWYAVTASWLGFAAAQRNGPTNNFAYGAGPESAHILWTLPYTKGGIMDARFESNQYYTGLSYENIWSNVVILNGKLYYNVLTPPRYGWYCVDLRSGTIDYFRNSTGPVTGQHSGYFDDQGAITGDKLMFGQIYNYDSPNQHGGMAYLWTQGVDTKTWNMYDEFTGNYICSIANTTSPLIGPDGKPVMTYGMYGPSPVSIGATGFQVYGKDGSILYYNTVNVGTSTAPNYYLQVWNNTYAILMNQVQTELNWYWYWRPYLNYTFDGRNGFSTNITTANLKGAGSIMTVREGQYVIGGIAGRNNGTFIQKGQLWALNLDPAKGAIGSLLWNVTFTPPADPVPDIVGHSMTGPYVDPEDGVFVFTQSITRQWWGFDLSSGQQIWGPTASEPQFNYYGMSYNFYQGKLLSYGIGGILVAYDVKSGKQVWNFTSGTVGFEDYFSGSAPISGLLIADGKIYGYSSEHSPSTPLRRDAFLWAINATDGTLLWKIQAWPAGLALADGYIVGLDLFDNQIYCYGKGPSATTVTLRNDVVAKGSTILVTGSVTDQSPGAKGTPAISDQDQAVWMEYLYQQKTKPTNIKGVTLEVTAIDPNGNFQDLGPATCDENGNFGITWLPPVEGKYQIVATFDGSKSYGGSTASTFVAVVPAGSAVIPTPTSPQQTTAPASPTPAQTPTSAPTSSVIPPNYGTSTTTYVAIGAAVIIVVAAAAALILRKRKK